MNWAELAAQVRRDVASAEGLAGDGDWLAAEAAVNTARRSLDRLQAQLRSKAGVALDCGELYHSAPDADVLCGPGAVRLRRCKTCDGRILCAPGS